jgi:hypothetical protein
MAADEGRGTTVTFGTSSFTAQYLEITPDAITRDMLETTHLGTITAKSFTAADLIDSGGFTATFFHDGDEQPPYNGAAETVTITDPLQSGWSTGPKIAGSAQVDSYTPGSKRVGELMQSTMHVKFVGTITFTDHT